MNLTTDRLGNPDNAYLFEDYSDLLVLPNSIISGLVDYTISFWIKADDLKPSSVFFSWSNINYFNHISDIFLS